MSEGQTIGLVITIVAVLALTGALIWLFATGTKPHWPEGITSKAEHAGYRSIVIWGNGTTVHPWLAYRVARATWATAAAWHQIKGKDPGFDSVGVHVLTDEEFEEAAAKAVVSRDPTKVQAFLSKGWQRLGNGPPMPVLRESLVSHAVETGQPIIHELIHALDGLYHDRMHEDDSAWEDRDDPEVEVEERAEQLYIA